ncbi:sodium:solute symporter family transporter [Pontibacter mangrovi]|uniref:Na+:solute symporter n=1 Tax=Pontibacter mangrovi TaxID=2589816 RepID=A0A501W0Z1_9BACT|nr:Na+:solute symporter [Pontibacter mangrovi]TPE42382.1 Na+:solute symporter [Pontibacter mangrovi]
MNSTDLVVLVIYLAGLLVMGSIFSRLKTTQEMFAAGGQSPWWLSGLSAFMTTFSAGTFVVWGGIAYQHGMVGVSILAVIGIASMLVGWVLAARWKSFGYDSAAAFLDARFGRSIVQFYTWLQGTVGVFTMGGAIYALAVIVTALIPLPADHFLADPETGRFSVTVASLLISVLVILITSSGGLWAVLMTDALQFIILTVSVLVVVPLILLRVGGPEDFVSNAPEGFFSLVSGEFTWWFLAGWSLVFFFKMGGEWAYIQRFVCVPSQKDARKSSYLFGILYLVSPLIWMLPPMAYRLINPAADPEQAYILACQVVLPAGMLGLMIAAMCSATASMVTTQLNVFAGAFTTEFYQRLLRPEADEKELVVVGRVITLLLGGIAIAGALIIPRMGTYTGYILASVAILTGPLVLPTIWGLFSRKIGLGTAWTVTLLSIAVGLLVKGGLQRGGWFVEIPFLASVTELAQLNERMTEIVIGTAFPLLLLVIAEGTIKETHAGWERILASRARHHKALPVSPSPLPARLCGWSTMIIGILMLLLAFTDREDTLILGGFAVVLLIVGGGILLVTKRLERSAAKQVAAPQDRELVNNG